MASLTSLCAPPASAHHSYADFDAAKRFTLVGTLTDVQWTNPHILLFVSAGEQAYRVEWMTLSGAERTDVSREQFEPGETITVIGSRHRNPNVAVVALVTELALPDDNWHWQRPTGGRSIP